MTNEEKRRHPRYPCIVVVQYVSDSPLIKARLLDISRGGIFVDTVNPLPEGAVVKFRFSLPGDAADTPIVGEGKVAWHQHTVGMGIEFLKMSGMDSGRLAAFLQGRG